MIDEDIKKIIRSFEENPTELAMTRIKNIQPYLKFYRIRVKIIKKCAPREIIIRDKKHMLLSLIVGDNTGTIQLTLWDEVIKETLYEGRCYEFRYIKSDYISEEMFLNSMPATTFEEIADIGEINEGSSKDGIKIYGDKPEKYPFFDNFYTRRMYDDYLDLNVLTKNFFVEMGKRNGYQSCLYCKKIVNKNILEYLKEPFCHEYCKTAFFVIRPKVIAEMYLEDPHNSLKCILDCEKGVNKLQGKYLFDLTFKPLRLGHSFKVYVPLSQQKETVYTDVVLCPELESLLNLTLWFRKSETFHSFIDEYKTFKDKKDAFGILSDNYYLRLPNKVWRAHSTLSTSISLEGYYDWRYVPFLEETYDSLQCHNTPTGYTRLSYGDTEYFVNFRVIIGVFDFLKGDHAKFWVPDENGRPKWSWFKIVDPNILNIFRNMQKNTINYLLLGEQINEEKETERIIFGHSIEESDITHLDIAIYLAKYKLYQLYLNNKGFYCCDYHIFEKFVYSTFNNVRSFIVNPHNDSILEKSHDLVSLVLANMGMYFKRVWDNIYYMPKLLHSDNDLTGKLTDVQEYVETRCEESLSKFTLPNSVRQDILRTLFIKDLKRISIEDKYKHRRVFPRDFIT